MPTQTQPKAPRLELRYVQAYWPQKGAPQLIRHNYLIHWGEEHPHPDSVQTIKHPALSRISPDERHGQLGLISFKLEHEKGKGPVFQTESFYPYFTPDASREFIETRQAAFSKTGLASHIELAALKHLVTQVGEDYLIGTPEKQSALRMNQIYRYGIRAGQALPIREWIKRIEEFHRSREGTKSTPKVKFTPALRRQARIRKIVRAVLGRKRS